MMQRILLTLGSSRVRLALGLLLAILLLVQIVATFNNSNAGPPTAQAEDQATLFEEDGHLSEAGQIEQWGRHNHLALLRYCLQHYRDNYRDYTCTLKKTELLRTGVRGPQVIDVEFKEAPFSVLMSWRHGATRGDKVLYVERQGDGDDMMRIHPTGIWGRLFRSVERSPDDPDVRANSLRSIRDFGFARGLAALIDVYTKAEAAGHLPEGSCKWLGTRISPDGRDTFAIQRILPPGHGYPAKLTVIEFDREYLVPVRIYGTNWQDQELCEYIYTDIHFNPGLTDKEFTREANGL